MELKVKCLDALKKASALLEAKAPEGAAAVKQWFYHISQKVADAEGGFMGFGDTKVTDAEKAALCEILLRQNSRLEALRLALFLAATAWRLSRHIFPHRATRPPEEAFGRSESVSDSHNA